MTNHFCGKCGTLMYRVGERFPGWRILRLGTVDDAGLVDGEGVMRPVQEQFGKRRAGWVEIKGVKSFEEGAF
jgi:hypothetical protein